MKTRIYSLLFLSQLFLTLGSPIDSKDLVSDSSSLSAKKEAVSKYIAEGFIKLGKEKLDPIFIDFFHIDDSGFKFDLKNRTVHGLKNVVVDNVSVDASSKVVRILFHNDLTAKSLYAAEGTLLSLPMNGKGVYTIKFNDIIIDMVIPFDIVKDANGKDVIDLKNYQYTYEVRRDVQFQFENLYYGNKEMSDKMHQILSQNWKLLMKKYGIHILNKVNDRVFDSMRNYMFSQPLDSIV